MAGPRVSSGVDSKQDYQTPKELMAAVEKRFGKVQFDLAAVAANAQHERYFAPTELVSKIERGRNAKGKMEYDEVRIPHFDPKAYAHDAFAHPWHELSKKFRESAIHGPGLLWLNCEFGDITPWALKCSTEMSYGANIMLLTPAVATEWYRDFIAGRADVYKLIGRVSFDGKNVFPKDCMVSHFHPMSTGAQHLWDWRTNKLERSWSLMPNSPLVA